jgi:hypothetical protein
MKEELISFKTAKLAKEKGFNEICDKAFINYYSKQYIGKREYQVQLFHSHVYKGANPVYLAPTQSLLQKFIREVHNIIIISEPIIGYGYVNYTYHIYTKNNIWNLNKFTAKTFNTYEEALEVGLYQALKLIK